MPRIPRKFQKSFCYHLFNRGLNRQRIFEDDADRQHFTELVIRYRNLYRARIYHWVWMDNHYHLLIEVAFDNLRPLAGGLQQSYAQYHHARHRGCGTFWQGRFQTKPVETGPYLERCGRYIERNPVRRHQVAHAWDYYWSSAAAYVLGVPDGLTEIDSFPAATTRCVGQPTPYATALQSLQDDAWMRGYDGRSVIGSDAFAHQLRITQGRHRRAHGRSTPPV